MNAKITQTDIETAAAKIGNSAAGLIESHSREIADAIKKCAEASDSNKPFALAIAVRIGRNSDNGKINVKSKLSYSVKTIAEDEIEFGGQTEMFGGQS